jgi:DNA-binding NarL/FixJ family response regulator
MAKAVLIVDDNATIGHIVCEAFKKKSDLKICGEAANGKEAIDKAQELRPDLIVLDLSTTCQSILYSLPFGFGIRSLRNRLEAFEDCGFCRFDSLRELFGIKL